MTRINTIAIIDDDPITTFGLKKLISLTGYEGPVETYVNGKLALDQIIDKIKTKALIPEIIFLDINMPIMDGWEFLTEFLKLEVSQKVKINIVTSSIDPYDKDLWKLFKQKTAHNITFSTKPINKFRIKAITKVA